jgi:hypothetical protein
LQTGKNRRVEHVLPGGVGISVGEEVRKGYRKVNMAKMLYIHECKWKKRYLLKRFLEWRGGGIKENGGEVNSSMTYLLYVRTFVNTTIYPT